jgi:zinc transport system substrate-binding protein
MRSIPTVARVLLRFILIMRRRPTLAIAVAVATGVAIAAVSGTWHAAPAVAAPTVGVAASFYPVAFAAQTVGGKRVDVTNLTPVGAEPHDLELTSEDLDRLLEAKVAFVLGDGFQPAVEKAARRRDKPPIELLPKLVDTQGKKVAKEGSQGGIDPHVWLDPVLMSQLVGEVEHGLAAADKKGAASYQRNAAALQQKLAELDTRYRERLTGCARDLLVTSHEAFGYLTSRYGLRQQGVAGLSPDAEPDPARLGELAQLARDQGVTTVFTEENVSPRIARTLAREAGGLRTEVLSPLESLSKQESKKRDDYFTLMDANLNKIASALGCPPRS